MRSLNCWLPGTSIRHRSPMELTSDVQDGRFRSTTSREKPASDEDAIESIGELQRRVPHNQYPGRCACQALSAEASPSVPIERGIVLRA